MTVYAVCDGEFMPTVTGHEVQTLSGASPPVIADTLVTRLDMRVLYWQTTPEHWIFDGNGMRQTGDDMGDEFRMWFVPHVLPSDPEARDM